MKIILTQKEVSMYLAGDLGAMVRHVCIRISHDKPQEVVNFIANSVGTKRFRKTIFRCKNISCEGCQNG